MGWTIKGDSDITPRVIGGITYGLNGTVRTFESMDFTGWTLRTESCGDDVFSFSQRVRNAKGSGVIVPEDGQNISVFYDGERKLLGKVRKPKLGLDTLTVSAFGPWAEMTEIQLSGTRTDETGASSDRGIFAVPAQGIRETLRDLINRAADMGVPVNKITTDTEMGERISAMFGMKKMTLSNMSFAAAFTEVMGLVPDAVAFWDYTQTPPALCVKRRSSMTPLSYAVGASGTTRVTRCDIAPRKDQNVRRLELKYIQRHEQTGKTIFKTQAAGVAASSLTDEDRRRIQVITFSGPELNDFVPKDDIESVVLRTEQVRFSLAWVLEKDQVIKDLKTRFGWPAGVSQSGFSPLISNAFYLRDGEPTEWLKKEQSIKSREVRVTGWMPFTFATAGGWGSLGTQLQMLGRARRSSPGWEIFVDFTVPVINKDFPKKTRFYKALSYQYSKPGDGLAADLLSCRNFTPWEGQVEITRPDLTGYNALQRTLNITNAHPDYDGMDAMIRAVTYDGRAHTVTFDLGGPARTSFGSLVNRAKASGKDNFEYL